MAVWKVWHNFGPPDIFEADCIEAGTKGSLIFVLNKEVVAGYGVGGWGRVRKDHCEDIEGLAFYNQMNKVKTDAKGK